MRICLLTIFFALAACGTPTVNHTTMAPKPQPAPGSPEEAADKAEEERIAALESEPKDEKVLLALIGTAGDDKAMDSVLGSASGPNNSLDLALSAKGVGVGSGGLGGGGIGGLGVRGTGSSGGAGYGGLGARNPGGTMQLGTTTTTNMADSAARQVLARRANQYRYCYMKSLHTNPKAGGVMNVELAVDENGRVAVTKASVVGNIDTAMLECVRRQLVRTRFPKPAGPGAATVSQALTFVVK